jgi:hypothetical protein
MSEIVASHFTYQNPIGDLCQGDILSKSEGIKRILSEIHPHYLKEDYSHLMVVTQTCDLVRRNGQNSKSRYLTLVAVRPLETVMQRELEKMQISQLEKLGNIASDKAKSKMQMFTESLLNNNNQEYFYLHDDANYDFFNASCAFLRLPISLRSSDHYETCLAARIMSLNDSFRAKLGFLAGTIYSRVGTMDFVPSKMTHDEFLSLINRILQGLCKWVPENRLKHLNKELRNNPDLQIQTPEQARKFVDDFQIPNSKDEVIERSVHLIKTIVSIEVRDEVKLRQLLRNDTIISSKFK